MTTRQPRPQPAAGEVWWVQFSPQVGTEQAGRRPGLVISNNAYNQLPHGLVIVVPMTTTDRGLRIHVRIDPPEASLSVPGFCMCEQARAISVERLERLQGVVSPPALAAVRQIVARAIDR